MWKSAGRAPSLRVLPREFALQLRKKARKNRSQGKKNLNQVKKNLSQSRKTSVSESSVKMTRTDEKYDMSNSLGFNRSAQTISYQYKL
jgi:L,D-peptidoglycan transpeptidase YkuD (ErfK/YbiS/YcfS/YnhG family)